MKTQMNPLTQNSNRTKAFLFSGIVLVLASLAPLLGGTPSQLGLGFVVWGIAPALVALVLRTVHKDWTDAGLKPGLRKNKNLYLAVIITVPLLMILNVLFGMAISAISITGFDLPKYLVTALIGLIVFFLFSVFEEFGWRGYLVPKLAQAGINDVVSYVLIGAVWATWHLPYIAALTWVYSTGDMLTFIPIFYLSMIAYSVLYYEIRLATASVWPAVLLHSLTNALQHPLAAEFLETKPGVEYLVSFTGLFMIVCTGALGLMLRRHRTTRKASDTIGPEGQRYDQGPQ